MKLGYSTWGMPTVPIDVAMRHVRDVGYDGIEITVLPNYTTALESLDHDARLRIRTLIDECQLELPAIAAHSNLVAADPVQRDAAMNRLKGAVDLALELVGGRITSPPAINTTSGGKPEEFEKLKPVLIDRVGEIVEYALVHGVTIAMEPHVGGAIDRPDRVLWLLREIDRPNLMVNFDDSHFAVQGIGIEETVPALAPHTVHTHIKDFRGRYPDFEFVVPGDGEYDNAAYLGAMKEAGYEGFITVEVSIMVQRKPGYDPLEAASRSYVVINQAFEDAAIKRD